MFKRHFTSFSLFCFLGSTDLFLLCNSLYSSLRSAVSAPHGAKSIWRLFTFLLFTLQKKEFYFWQVCAIRFTSPKSNYIQVGLCKFGVIEKYLNPNWVLRLSIIVTVMNNHQGFCIIRLLVNANIKRKGKRVFSLGYLLDLLV